MFVAPASSLFNNCRAFSYELHKANCRLSSMGTCTFKKPMGNCLIGFEKLAWDKVNYPIVPSPRWENECEMQVVLMEGKESKSLTQISVKLLEWIKASRPSWNIYLVHHSTSSKIMSATEESSWSKSCSRLKYWKHDGNLQPKWFTTCQLHQMIHPFIFDKWACLNVKCCSEVVFNFS